MKTNKRYFLNVIEEGIQNEEYKDYRGGRIEVTDTHSDDKYPVYEARWLVPQELAEQFYELFNWKELDVLPVIDFNMEKK